MIVVRGPRDCRARTEVVVNVTSSAQGWSRGLSPFLLGPVELYDGFVSLNVENAWQYAKVYPDHVDANGEPTAEYWFWARRGWAKEWADRYPMGRGAIPLFSLWRGRRLSYLEARREIYVPLYARAVAATEAYARLAELSRRSDNIVLFDYDGYDYGALGMNLDAVLNEPRRRMGHAFVLAMMLEGLIDPGAMTTF